MMREIIAVDVGGTHVRFCRASLDASNTPQLGPVHKYKVADFPSLPDCWRRFAADDGMPLPTAASIAFAAPVRGERIKLTNSNWLIVPATLAQELNVDNLTLVNDFEAVGHAISRLPMQQMELWFGPDIPLPAHGAVTVIGPGTGLGVALIAFAQSGPIVIATEGGHMDFAPLDAIETRLLEQLRAEHGRVSVERLVSGPGLNAIYRGLGLIARANIEMLDDAALWAAALEGSNALARQALDRLCMCYGSIAGDLALAHGPSAVVLAGGLTARMKDLLLASNFHARFIAKGRYENLMRGIPIRFAAHDDIGLFGAAAAFGARL